MNIHFCQFLEVPVISALYFFQGFYGYGLTDTYIGDEALRQKHLLNYEYPIRRGIITNWDDMERMWSYVYDKLKVTPEEQPTLLTETPDNPKTDREKMTEVTILQ